MSNKTTSGNSESNGSIFNFVLVIYVLGILIFSFYNTWFPKCVYHTFNHNFLVILWNIFIFFIFVYAFSRMFISPLWKMVFIDINKLGQKLEWYDGDYKHLSPTKNYIRERWIVSLTITFSMFFLRFFPIHFFRKWSLVVSHFRIYDLYAQVLSNYYENHFFFLDYLLPIVIYLWLVVWMEGRTRMIYRFFEKKASVDWKDRWKKDLKPNPFVVNSENLKISVFSTFINFLGEHSKEISNDEEWEVLEEKALRANILCIGPVGSGKTEAFIKPFIDQAMAWNAEDSATKASMSVHDPKGGIAKFVKMLAEKYNRLGDLILLSIHNDHKINVISIKNIWRDDSAFKVTGWILGAWQNFQGKTSPEPYWENQNFILIRNVLVNLYIKKGENVTIYDISKKYDEAANGCFTESKDGKKKLTAFGEEVVKNKLMATFTDLDSGEVYAYLSNYSVSENESDYSKFTDDIILKTHQRIEREKEEYKKFREKTHMTTDKKLRELKESFSAIDESTEPQKTIELKVEFTARLSSLVDSDIKEKYDKKSIGSDDYKKTLLVEESKVIQLAFTRSFSDSDELVAALSIAKDACDWLIDNWSMIVPENRGSIVSNLQPFLKMFETPKIKRILSPEESNINFDEAVCNGKIIVPAFPAREVGDGLSSGIITLIKSRWQYAVLENPESKRLKIQIIDEYQKTATFSQDKSTGDFEYMELSRENGGCTALATQSISAIKQKAPKEADFNKIHGVIRSIINFPTNDPESINFIQKVSGRKERKRISRTVQEGAQAPELENISEKYSATSSSLSVSFTESEHLEDVIQSSDIQEAEAWTGMGIIYDGEKTTIRTIAFKPFFWSNKQDKWKKMKTLEFKDEKTLPNETPLQFYLKYIWYFITA